MTPAIDLIEAARDDCEAITSHLLGAHNARLSGNVELRWGSKGSFKLRLSTGKRGKWTDYASGEYGDTLDLIKREKGFDTKAALEWLAEWFGGVVSPIDHEARKAEIAKAEKADHSARIAKLSAARKMWLESLPLKGSIAEQYLMGRMGGATLPDDVYQAGQLRFHPAPFMARCAAFAGDAPLPNSAGALLARMVNPVTGEAFGVHRTFLTADSQKIERKMLGSPGVVKLCDPENNGEAMQGLAIGEGLESSLAVLIRYNWKPTWATLTAGQMRAFPLLENIDTLALFSDNDVEKKGKRAGNDAARECGLRWQAAGREALIITPPAEGTDFADLQTGEAA